jgi:primosomal protein N'
MECAKCNEEAGNELYCDECQEKVESETAIEMQGAEIVQLRARVAELEATYSPDCATCARYDQVDGCGWTECYGNAVDCYLAKGEEA